MIKKIKLSPEKVFFYNYSAGINTSRDAWCYNFSKDSLVKNIQRTIKYYNDSLTVDFDKLDYDSTKISWGSTLQNYHKRNIKID